MEQPKLQPREHAEKSLSNPATDGITEMSLREHLLAAQAAGQLQSDNNQFRPDNSSSLRQLDSDMVSSSFGPIGMDGHMMELDDDDSKEKRGLSTSKRAAQNRAAQRAFRQRKEGYIKKLEDQVRNFNSLQESYRSAQSENYQLRDYVLALQSRLMESQGDFPQPPPSIDLRNPRPPLVDDLSELQEHLAGATSAARTPEVPTAPMGSSAASQLARAAVQAGEYVAADLERRHYEESERPYLFGSEVDRRESPRQKEKDKTTI